MKPIEPLRGRIPREFSGFQVMGMIEGFFLCLKFSIPGFFGEENLASSVFGWLDLSWDFWGDFFAPVVRTPVSAQISH